MARPNPINRREWFRRSAVASAALFIRPEFDDAPAYIPPAHQNLVRLSSNENPYGPSKMAREAMIAAFDESCRYPGNAERDLVKAIAEKEGLTPDHVLIGSGSREILCLAGLAYGLEGGEIVAADPTYQNLLTYAETMGAHVLRVPVDEEMRHDFEAMDRHTTQSAKLIYVCNPNNPTGTLMDAGMVRSFCEEASRKAVVFADEAYNELLADPRKYTLTGMVKDGENIIVARTFSKVFGLAGQRVGYALARPDIIRRMAQYSMVLPNVIGLRAALASWNDEAFQAFSRQKTVEGRQLVYAMCEDLGYRYIPSEGNFVFFHTGVPIQRFQRVMREKGILVGRPFPPFLDWCRISIGTVEEVQQFVDVMRTKPSME